MASFSNIKCIPENLVRGMKVLDREKFLRTVRISLLKFSNDNTREVLFLCRPYMIKVPRFKSVQDINEEHKSFNKCIFLNPEKVKCWNDISENDRLSLKKHNVTEDNIDFKEIQLTYENLSYETIFKAVLPENVETVSGFSQVGHIIHLNLRDHLLEYKSLIGSVLLDKVRTCRTVVNKTHIIDNRYRNFQMELLAGDDDFIVTARESHCTFQFDFSKVYWNPRLCREHERIIKCMKPDDILFDVFCGVGPFAIPVVKKKCQVYANDLNPESYKWLKINAKINHVDKALFRSYNLDGKVFICTIFKDFIKEHCKGNLKISPEAKIRVTMNLPGMATEFLKHFNGLIDEKELIDHFNLNILVYVYCFTTPDAVETSKKMVIDNIGRDVRSDINEVIRVRRVSPNKDMMRVTFQLTKETLFGVETELTEPPPKRKCEESIQKEPIPDI